MEIKVGDWVEVDTHFYTQIRKGTVGYVEQMSFDEIYFNPTYHPDGKPIKPNLKLIKKRYVNLLQPELTIDELNYFIDLAIKDKDKAWFMELTNRLKNMR